MKELILGNYCGICLGNPCKCCEEPQLLLSENGWVKEESKKIVDEIMEGIRKDLQITDTLMSPQDYVERHENGKNDCYCALIDYNSIGHESLYVAMESYAKYYHDMKINKK